MDDRGSRESCNNFCYIHVPGYSIVDLTYLRAFQNQHVDLVVPLKELQVQLDGFLTKKNPP